MQARTGHLTVLRELAPYIWPAGRPDLRMRVVFALIALIIAKAITLLVPIAYKAMVDLLTGEATGKEITAVGLAASPVFLIVAYGVGRVMMVVFAQFRDVWFTAVAQNAVRKLANRTFSHLHALSLRFHLERRTGGLNRVIERGVTGVDTIVRMAVLNSIPTAVELLMISGLVAYYFGWIYVVVVLVTVALYVAFTFWASERRIAIRRDMNDSDTEAHAKAVDSLLNYETVKYFGNEAHEARRFDASMARYERGGDPHLYLARVAEHRAGGDLHAWNGDLHAARGARRRLRYAHHRRIRDDQCHPDAALSAAQFHGHGVSRDQAGPDRHRDHVRAAARAGGDHRPAGRQAAARDQGRDQDSRTCPSPTIQSGRS